jgi:hypothetical protein
LSRVRPYSLLIVMLIVVCLSFSRSATASESRAEAPEGAWEGSIRTSAGEVNFGIELKPREMKSVRC